MLESLLQDVRYGARLLRRSPLFAAVAVGSIACGLAAAIGLFTFANGLVFRPLGGHATWDVYKVHTANGDGSPYGGNSFADFRDFSTAQGIFSAMCATDRIKANFVADGRAEVRLGAMFSPQCFAVLDVRPAAGRLFDAPSPASPAIVLSYAMWRTRFNAKADAVGRRVLLNGISGTIVGVAERGFDGTSFDASADFWVEPASMPSLMPFGALEARGHRSFTVLARLRDGVGAAQAEAALAGIAAGLQRRDPKAWTDRAGHVRRVSVLREVDARFASAPGAVAGILGGVVSVVILILAIACVNVATLMLARGASRTRELTIRLAVGASRGRLLRQLAIESLLVASIGTAVAAAATAIGLRVMQALRPAVIPALNLAVDWRVIVFAALGAVLASLLFGLAPGIHVVRIAVAEGMKGRAAAVRSKLLRAGAREALIVVQVAASVGLLIVASLFAGAMAHGTSASPGFRTDGVAVVDVDMTALDARRVPQLTDGLLRAIGNATGAAAPSIAVMVPLMGNSTTFAAKLPDGTDRALEGNIVSPGYFETMGIPLRAGRNFNDADRAGSRPVAIASETLARTLFNTRDAIGRTLTIHDEAVEIVGIAADARYRAVNEPFRPVVYLPFAQLPQPKFIVHARFRDGESLAAIGRAARSVDPAVLIDEAVPLASRIDEARIAERATQWIGVFGGATQLALVLMAVWALVAYAVERRRAEIGVRLALGATPGMIVRQILRPSMILIAAGTAIGGAAGVGTATVMQSEFVGLGELRFVSALPAILVVALVAAAAAVVPARRAGRVDPIVALRAE